MQIFLDMAQGGWSALQEYLSAHVITCLVPAFFIAGAIAVFVSQSSIIKYFGPKSNRVVSYGVASVSGAILAVCSCTVLPLFGGIYKRGAGLGPAVAFLYSGPAINVLAVVYTARLLGYDLGAARATGAVLFAVFIGIFMAFIFRKEARAADQKVFDMMAQDDDSRPWWKQVIFFVLLVGVLIFAASKIWIGLGLSLAGVGITFKLWFTREDFVFWMKETWRFTKLIVPWLLGGVFIAGIITVVLPQNVVGQYVGGNSVGANLGASMFGSLMYFATLTEVPIIRALVDLGMGKGPSLALLLAGPALSLPNMLVIRSIMGTRKTLAYVGMVVVFATFTGFTFGFLF